MSKQLCLFDELPVPKRFQDRRDPEYAEQAASVIRGVLIDRLDDLADTHIRRLCDEYGFTPMEFIRFLQEVQLALFPEEFAEPETDPASGLLPLGGVIPRRNGTKVGLGADRLAAFAELLKG